MHDLRLIRATMEKAGAFRAVPGLGAVLMGFVALVTDWCASSAADRTTWMAWWLGGAVVAIALGAWALAAKAASTGVPLRSGPGRRFLICLGSPLLAGALMTVVLWERELLDLLPGLWLLLYGAGVLAAGALSLPLLAMMGATFMAMGAAALLVAPGAADRLMAAGFGGAHLFFGLLIASRHHGTIDRQAFPD